MSWQASAYVKELVVCPNGERLTRTEKLVALILADSHQIRAERCTYPSVREMAADALIDLRTCRRLLTSLAQKGVIEILRPERQGAGKINCYRFPQLDKGGQDTLLFYAKRGAEGGQKEDKSGTPPHPLLGRTRTRTKTNPPPSPSPQAGGETLRRDEPGDALKAAVEQVMQGCSFKRRRLQAPIRDQLQAAADRGEALPTVALAMIAAWRQLSQQRHLLRYDWGPSKFFGDGHWREGVQWPWDHKALEQSGRRVG